MGYKNWGAVAVRTCLDPLKDLRLRNTGGVDHDVADSRLAQRDERWERKNRDTTLAQKAAPKFPARNS
jgi:hypothetical protein